MSPTKRSPRTLRVHHILVLTAVAATAALLGLISFLAPNPANAWMTSTGANWKKTSSNLNVTSWSTLSVTLPGNLNSSQLAIIDDYVYLFGGHNGTTAVNVIYRAPLSNPAAWVNTGATLPGPLATSQLAVIGSYIYLFGGSDTSTPTNVIYRAPVSNPTSWTNTGATLPAKLNGSSLAIIGDYVYLFGGFVFTGSLPSSWTANPTSAIYRAPVSNPTSWTTTGSTLPASLNRSQLAIIGDYAYLFGGDGKNVIYRAPVTNPTSWTNTAAVLPSNLDDSHLAIIGDYAYLFGGGGKNVIYRAPLSSPTSWADTGVTLSARLDEAQLAVIGGEVYLFGGSSYNGTSWIYNGIYRTPFATTPTAPQSPSATAGVGKITLNWSAPSSNGGSAITGYKVYRGISSPASDLIATLGTVLTYNDLTAATGTTYYFRVKATNSVGDSPYSSEVSATIQPAPTCSITFTPAFVNQGGSATLTFSSTNATSGTIDNGVGSATPVAGGTRSVSPSATTAYTGTFTGAGGSVQCQGVLPVNPPAGSTGNVTGWAWSDTIGWISLNCYDLGTCGTSTYGLNIASDGTFSGYAWSENVGWISANSSDLAGCPASPCTARMEGNQMKGWWKALAANQAEAAWDGFISLSGSSPNYGPTLSSGVFSGYAWGDTNTGWISFNSAYHQALTTFVPCTPTYQCTDETHYDNLCTTAVENLACGSGLICSTGQCVTPPAPFTNSGNELKADPRLIRPGATTHLTWNVTYATSCTVTEDNATITDSWNTTSGSVTSSPIRQQTIYTLQCTGPGGNLTERVTVFNSPTWREI